jgi:protein tyrosine phosphatase (PTP) superfamily phosphohydrolase (DUF442 family)
MNQRLSKTLILLGKLMMNAQRLGGFAVVLIALAVTPNNSSGQAGNAGPASVAQDVATSTQQATSVTSADFAEPQDWGAASNVVGVKHLYLSAQPDQVTLKLAIEHGVGVVINLREPNEQDWDENGAAASLGLTYYNLPIGRSGPGFDADILAQISKLVGKHRDTKILMHCSSGNRAGAWFAVHLVRDHGMPVERSIEMSQLVGLTNAGMKSRVREFLVAEPVSENDESTIGSN